MSTGSDTLRSKIALPHESRELAYKTLLGSCLDVRHAVLVATGVEDVRDVPMIYFDFCDSRSRVLGDTYSGTTRVYAD